MIPFFSQVQQEFILHWQINKFYKPQKLPMHSERKEELISSFRVQRTLGHLSPVEGLSVTFQTVNQDIIVPGTLSRTFFFFFWNTHYKNFGLTSASFHINKLSKKKIFNYRMKKIVALDERLFIQHWQMQPNECESARFYSCWRHSLVFCFQRDCGNIYFPFDPGWLTKLVILNCAILDMKSMCTMQERNIYFKICIKRQES